MVWRKVTIPARDWKNHSEIKTLTATLLTIRVRLETGATTNMTEKAKDETQIKEKNKNEG